MPKHTFRDAGLDELLAVRLPGQTFTLQAIAEACSVKQQSIRKIELQALSKLRRNVQRRFAGLATA